jgi:DNA-binding transcriptional ArsR family regulator
VRCSASGQDRLGGITPKTLSQRLDELTDAGIVSADREPGRREVRYSLTASGADLGPVIDALNWWGLRHAWRFPRPGEQLHAEHLLRSALQAIAAAGLAAGDREQASWHFRVDGDDYLAESDGTHWTLTASAPGAPAAPGAPTAPAPPADVTISATTQSLVALIFAGSDSDAEITGDPEAVRRFRRLIGAMAGLVDPAQPGTATA